MSQLTQNRKIHVTVIYTVDNSAKECILTIFIKKYNIFIMGNLVKVNVFYLSLFG